MPVRTRDRYARRRGAVLATDTKPTLPVVDRPGEGELLAQLDLPLPEHRLGRHDQDALGTAGEPCLSDQQARLDRLAEPHLVGDQQARRPIAVHPLESSDLMRPGGHDRGRLADPLARGTGQLRGVGDPGPDQAAWISRRRSRRARPAQGLDRPWLGKRALLHLQPLRAACRPRAGIAADPAFSAVGTSTTIAAGVEIVPQSLESASPPRAGAPRRPSSGRRGTTRH